MRELYRSEHFIITLDEERKIVRRARTAERYASIAQMQAAYDASLAAMKGFSRPGYALLNDLRLAPPRNDPAFEQALQPYYERLYGGFDKIVIVVTTEAGRLQMLRVLPPPIAARMRVFTNEPDALAYLHPSPPGRRPGGPTRAGLRGGFEIG